ncbi:glycoside hydrolase family 38 C-terminal domain-containing protein [Humibacter albus]|uniref:glycoside hydrolase family 38 N-terminal domain-containing protein n=1 Tax=Humibacter albus TaxID=427754 RepID=UPI0003B5A026|nr:glycoside hydrolase family 38 C-terminal domain-containing protein [Humibacter albus]
MHDDSRLVLERIHRFLSERIAPAVYRQRVPLSLRAWEAPGEPVPFDGAIAETFSPFAVGSPWGKPWGTTWFHATGEVPDAWPSASTDPASVEADLAVELVVDLGFTPAQPGFQAEALVYAPNGTVVKAIEPLNATVRLHALRSAGAVGPTGAVDFYLEAASNPDVGFPWDWQPTPMGDVTTAGTASLYVLRALELGLRDVAVWELEQDVIALLGLHAQLPPASTRAAQILRALERMCDVMDPHDVAGTAHAGRDAVAGVLAVHAASGAHRVTAVGHAHIDSAWLWPVRETIRKCARTFSNVLALMDERDDFVFACSSAQQYAWMKQFYPELFERIRARVAEGRFVPVGGMWVESDTNMVGGEAMVRQFVTGQGFFRREFGQRAVTGWLPDSFGYTGALPQLMAGAGIEQFVTQKISWNDTDRFPHHTFWWEGIDGTRMFTHFPPMDTYNSVLSQEELARTDRQYAEKGEANSSLALFGHGDGGGGPTREMLASADRAASLDGAPTVTLGTPESFFEQAKAEYEHPPVWSGELYLELHRGTYTSQARTKQGNRRSEHLLREAELWAATAAVRTGAEYPYEELDAAWQTVLLQQFHDILPGSAIAWVYRDAERNYREVAQKVSALIERSLTALGGVLLERAERVEGQQHAEGVEGQQHEARTASCDYFLNASPVPVRGVPALGAGVPAAGSEASIHRDGTTVMLQNARARFVLDARGRLVSAVDLATGREAIAPGESAGLQIFRDTPTKWDAWDIDEHYRRHEEDLDQDVTLEVDEQGGTVRTRRIVGDSVIEQEFSLAPDTPTLEVTTRADWHERQRMLKFAFPLDVRAERAASEVQFGHVFRATHENTSWDFARFETAAHRWVHVGEPGFGVAVANDSTYGHDISRRTRRGGGTSTLVRQSLLRAPLFPDPDADQGEHVLRSSLTVGAQIPDAVAAGYALNLPLRAIAAPIAPLVSVVGAGADGDTGVLVESVKLAEDRSGDVIVRLYESLGRRTNATVRFGFETASVVQTDLLEDELAEPDGVEASDAAEVRLSVRPFQVVTLRVARR